MAEDAGGTDPEPAPSGGPPLIGVAFTLAGIGLLVVLIALIEPLRIGVGNAVQGDTASLRQEIRDLHLGGVLIVLGLALAHAVIWYPAEILDAAAGFVYGFWLAMPLIMFGWLVNAVVAYWIGRHAARPVLFRFVRQDRFQRLERVAEEGGVPLLLGMRLIPIIPFSLFSIVAGAAHVAMPRFLWTTAVGYIPITVVFVYLGSQLEELSLTDPLLWAGAAVLIALIFFTHRLGRIFDRGRDTGDEGAAEGPAR
jgi:uncharacterized membrane protein YdjX (TVP38/TMEM64 family)